ncbi:MULTISPECIES: DUF1295 domain-containing protein [unclassified Pseudovibrio]|uniref:DUF1295 domain-containing protein n=1 Tax=unclassified Pseudovibrio TaxID=2627060 RepID=UPI0007AEC4D6|nr:MULTISPECIES: DUF1295 domain-containing protein [unclassified Pseudovibrio]KZL24607.1 hypothetical protein PsAD37_02622 [Pseudovibrio sp. Ad37]KZL24631.1 hypothetical protein PsWM33_02485 [Pseudovibrio sp. WM33]
MSHTIWLLIANTALFTSLGFISALRTGDTRWPFIYGFFSILPATIILAWYGEGAEWRRILITVLVFIYVARMLYTLLAWFGATGAAKLKDQTPTVALVGLPIILVPIFSWVYPLPFFWAMDRADTFDSFDVIALLSYSVGTVFHFGADLQKWRYRQNSENKGKLLQKGFWGMSRHPNYFGDFLIYCSFAAISVTPWGLVSPAINLLQYAFDAIPKNESGAKKQYGDVWATYAETTPIFFPFRRYQT